jgi:hypothetical protein
MIQITDTISLDEHEIHEEIIRASGPGGQNIKPLKLVNLNDFNMPVLILYPVPEDSFLPVEF